LVHVQAEAYTAGVAGANKKCRLSIFRQVLENSAGGAGKYSEQEKAPLMAGHSKRNGSKNGRQ